METNPITVQTTIAADPATVWACWTQPEHITQWNFATDDWQCPRAENDLRPGGTYRARMEAKDGSFGFDFEAVYDEVVPGQRIAYTMGDGRKAITQFEPREGGTHVTTHFDAESVHDRELQRSGWQAILDNFRKHTEHVAATTATAS